MSALPVMRLEDLWGGELTPCQVGSAKVFLVRFGQAVFAYRDRCPHQGVPLSEGMLEGKVLTCRAHHHQFDVETGAGVNPADAMLCRHAVRIEDGLVLVEEAGHE